MLRHREELPGLAFTGVGVDRRGERRIDPLLLPGLLADAATAVVELRGDRVQVTDSSDGRMALVTRPPGAQDETALTVYLGEAGGAAYVLVVADAEDQPADGWRTLRQVGLELSEAEVTLLVTANGLANWHRAHTHCPRCGTPTVPDQAGWVRRCPLDQSLHFPRTDPAVIMSVVDEHDRLLLAHGRDFRAKGMSVLAGFVEPGESLAGAVAREVHEEVGIEVLDVTYLGDQPWPFPSSLMVGFTARARSGPLAFQDHEIESARWFTREELKAAVETGEVLISPRLSIARRLIEHWYGEPIDAPDEQPRSLRQS